jgi:hypothetical protein
MRKVAASLIKEALKGSIAAVREIADRLDGKPIQQHQFDMEERIKLIAIVPEKAATTEDWLKLVGEPQKFIVHEPMLKPRPHGQCRMKNSRYQ